MPEMKYSFTGCHGTCVLQLSHRHRFISAGVNASRIVLSTMALCAQPAGGRLAVGPAELPGQVLSHHAHTVYDCHMELANRRRCRRDPPALLRADPGHCLFACLLACAFVSPPTHPSIHPPTHPLSTHHCLHPFMQHLPVFTDFGSLAAVSRNLKHDVASEIDISDLASSVGFATAGSIGDPSELPEPSEADIAESIQEE
eukprot:scaffold648023_cov26-Prasinocladus_malaysianus.AAC.1